MSCEDNVCGTGGWDGPVAGDPDNIITLAARTVYGGIDVTWSYPLRNPFAVAFTIVYRGTSNDFSKALEQARIGSSIYYDKLNPALPTEYFYWVKMVSINGTINEPIGPTSAVARPLVQQTLESLTGMIDAGKLAQDLKTSIAGLTNTNDALYKEINDRLLANTAFAKALADVQSGLTQAITFVSDEVTQRVDGDSALVQEINILAAANQTAMAAIDDERTVRISKDDALAQRIESMLVTVGENTAAIQLEQTVRADHDSALAQQITQIAASTAGGAAAAAVQDEMTARVNADEALAQRITTAESSLNGNVATGQIGLITKVNEVNGVVTDISSEYFAKVEANGLVGGFGLYNDSKLVEAGFDVDRFWIGRTGPNSVKPFIVDNGIVYMDKARIRNADIDSLKIAGSAVTVPITARTNNVITGSGLANWKTMIAGYIKLDQPGIVYAHCICFQTYGQGVRKWQMRISINGQVGSSIGGQSVIDTPVIAQSLGCQAGVIPIIVEWSGENTGVRIQSADLFIIGAKR